MTGFEIIILIVAIAAIALIIAYNFQKGTKAMSEFKTDYDNNAEAQEVVELAKELYNKDLRPIVAKKATEKPAETSKSEFPIDRPKKKRKYYPKKKKD